MSNILCEWAHILDDSLQRWFPIPTCSQMLRAYPDRFIEAGCFLLLDAFELFCQQSSNPNVASSTHSDYKKHCTIKILGGCDPIGCPWAGTGTVPDRYPGRASGAQAADSISECSHTNTTVWTCIKVSED